MLSIFLLLVFIITSTIYIVIIKKNKRKSKALRTINYGNGKKDYLRIFTNIFSKTPGIKNYYSKVTKRIEMIYPADHIAIVKKSTKIMLNSFILAILCFIAIITFNIITGFDLLYMLIGITMTYILFSEYINKQYENMEYKLLKQFGDFISDVRHYYHDCPCPDQAVYNTLDHLPKEIALHATKFYEIFSSSDVKIAASNYSDNSPNRFFTTFVAIGSSVMEYGEDTKEKSNFLKSLNYLKEELDIDILKKEENDYKFSGQIFVALFPIFLLKPTEIWVTSNIPEITSWYKGLAGTIVTILLIPITIICYQLLQALKNSRKEEKKKHILIEKLATIPFISALLNKEINRNYTKNQRIGDSLKLIGDEITPKQFLLKRVIYGIIILFTVNILFFISNSRERATLLTDFTTSYTTSILPSPEYRKSMQEITQMMVKEKRNSKLQSQENLTKEISQTTEITDETYADMISSVVIKRITEYQKVYYKYYFLLISLVAAITGYYIPYWILLYRKKIFSQSMADEVNQFETIILILMNNEGVTINTILEWMERFSYCFKTSIQECILELERGEESAMSNMKAKETYPAFRRFCDKLLSVDAVGVKEAFDEIDTDRAYYIQKRQLDNKKVMDNKSSLAKILCFVPLAYLIIMQLMVPFVRYSMEMMSLLDYTVL